MKTSWLFYVDASNYLIAFICRDFGGAYATLQYAQRGGKRIIQLANSHI